VGPSAIPKEYPSKCWYYISRHVGTTLETTLSPLSFGKSFMKIRSRERLSGILWWTEKTEKKTEKKSVKHIRIIGLIGGCVNKTTEQ